MPEPAPYVWRWRSRLPDRFGQACRVLVRGAMNSCLVEFEADGARFITSRNAVRRRPDNPKAGTDARPPAS